MKKIWKNYKSTIILLLSIIIGTIIGLIFKEKACVLSPLGDIFLNLMFVVIVPLIFLTITSSIIKMENPKRLGKIMITILIVFAVMSIIAALIGVVSSYTIKLIDSKDINNLTNLLNQDVVISEEVNILQKTANLLTVNDFYKIFYSAILYNYYNLKYILRYLIYNHTSHSINFHILYKKLILLIIIFPFVV